MFVNASDDETSIRDPLRSYNRVEQQLRMVALLMRKNTGIARYCEMRIRRAPSTKRRALRARRLNFESWRSDVQNRANEPDIAGVVLTAT